MSLSKIAHQMWRDHPFSQRNKATKRAADRVGKVGQNFLKRREVVGKRVEGPSANYEFVSLAISYNLNFLRISKVGILLHRYITVERV